MFLSVHSVSRERARRRKKKKRTDLTWLKLLTPMSYFKKRSWDECVMAWLRFRDPPSVARSVGAPQHPPHHRISRDFVLLKTWSRFRRRRMRSPYWLLGDSQFRTWCCNVRLAESCDLLYKDRLSAGQEAGQIMEDVCARECDKKKSCLTFCSFLLFSWGNCEMRLLFFSSSSSFAHLKSKDVV